MISVLEFWNMVWMSTEGTWHIEAVVGVVLVNAGDFLEIAYKQNGGGVT